MSLAKRGQAEAKEQDMSNCRKCGGTGKVQFTDVDGGRCWACGPKTDTSYTRKYVGMSAEELEAEHQALLAETVAAQAARRAARAAR